MKRFVLIPILAFFAFLVPSSEMASAEGGIAWPESVAVCTKGGNQENIRMVSDGSGGAIIIWQDYRNGNFDIYAQRIDKNRTPKWYPDGVVVCDYTGDQKNPVIVGDGYGGAIIAWEDYRSGLPNIYAVRITSATGETYTLWAPNGQQILPSLRGQFSPEIVQVDVDGQVGAFVAWKETDYAQHWIYTQKIRGDGYIEWLAAGVLVSSGSFVQESPKIINDGTGHVIITWQDRRFGNFDIYAQRIDIYDGTIPVSWDPNGQPVSMVTASDQKNPQIVPDGMGGAIIVWTDCRYAATFPDIYAQRISSDGVRLWTFGGGLEGIAVCKTAGQQDNANIVESHVGTSVDGAIIAWEDDALNGDIYAVKAGLYESNSDLTQGAKLIATGSQVQKYPRLVSDYQGGGIGAWIENDLLTSQYKIFATKRDHYGNPVWNIYPGVLVCQGSKIRNHQIVNDDAGGIIVAWEAIGASGSYDIFAQRVMEDAYIPSASICGRVTQSDGSPITGVDVWALQGEKIISSCITDTKGYYGITGLLPGTYLVRADWSANGIESSVSKEAFAPSYSFDFTLETEYELGTIAGNVSGVEREAKRVSGSGLGQSLSSASGIAFVELNQRGKVIVRVPLEMDGNYAIPNLLPGRFIARAYNGTIYSSSRTVDLSEGETLRVDFAFDAIPEEKVFNYPNPAKDGSTTIKYECTYTDPEAEIRIYNLAGELVRKVEDNEINRDRTDPHIYRFSWECENSSGKELASGIYIYVVEVKEKGGSESKKVIKRMAVIR